MYARLRSRLFLGIEFIIIMLWVLYYYIIMYLPTYYGNAETLWGIIFVLVQ